MYVKLLIGHVTLGGDFDSIVIYQIITMIIHCTVYSATPTLLYNVYDMCTISCNVAGKY